MGCEEQSKSKFSDSTPSTPTEAVRIINICFNIYTGTDWVRLSVF